MGSNSQKVTNVSDIVLPNLFHILKAFIVALVFFARIVSEVEMYEFGSKVSTQNQRFLAKMCTHGATPCQT